MTLPFDWHILRVGDAAGVHEFPCTAMIASREELDGFIQDNTADLGLDAIFGEGSFIEAAADYDDAYFGEKILLLVFLEEGSGSTGHDVGDLRLEEDTLVADVIRIPAGMGTADMAYWALMIELDRQYADHPVRVSVRD